MDIVKTITTKIRRPSRKVKLCRRIFVVMVLTMKIRRHNFTFREGRRIYYGLQMDTTRLVWARNLCEGWQIDIDGRRITVDCVLREITIGNGEIINY